MGGSFSKNKKYLAEQANKALFALFRQSRNLNLSIDLQIELFNKIVKPILLYRCEICGYGNCDDLERVQLKFLKYAFNLNKKHSNVHDLRRASAKPILIDIKTRFISFWSRLLSETENKLFSFRYKIVYQKHRNKQIKS